MKSGFVGNELKSFWEPRQVGEHLGFIIDFKEGTLSVTLARVQKFKTLLNSMVGMEFPTATFVAKVVGTIYGFGFRASFLNVESNVNYIWTLLKLLSGMLEFVFRLRPEQNYCFEILVLISIMVNPWGGYSVNLNGICAQGIFFSKRNG